MPRAGKGIGFDLRDARKVGRNLEEAGVRLRKGVHVPADALMAIVEYSDRFWAGGTGPDLCAVNVGRQPPEATKFSGRCGYDSRGGGAAVIGQTTRGVANAL